MQRARARFAGSCLHGCRRGVQLVVIVALMLAPVAGAVQVQDICRLKGAETNKLIGMGLVVGLSGTGDGGKFLPSTRMLAEAIGRFADPNVIESELRDGKSVALVYLSAELPANGVAEGDRVDVTISTAGPAKSLAGGTLVMTPLTGPRPGSPVMAIAEGKIALENPAFATTGVVSAGAQLLRDVRSVLLDQNHQIRLVVNDSHAGWPTTNAIASQINGLLAPDGPDIARAEDGKNIRIAVPLGQRENPSQFVNEVMTAFIDMSFVEGAARVVINERTKTIVISGSVSVSPVMIAHDGLTITQITPPPAATPLEPLVEQNTWIGVDPEDRGGTKLADLLAAFNRLKVDVEDQIDIIKTINQSGKLHGQLIIE